jgi:two-component system, cell cycle sensor histidine kinase and response regulator CckA
MSASKILVVEDETIVAMDIRQRLESMGYEVTSTVATGSATIEQASTNRPDLILMDIQIKGEVDGIETATQIQEQYAIPIIFLTANSDEKTLNRATRSAPFGYLLKPFEDKELHTTIELSLYRHQLEQILKSNQKRLFTTLSSIVDGIISTDSTGKIDFINPTAETLLGFSKEEIIGKQISKIIKYKHENTEISIENPVEKAIRKKTAITLENNVVLVKFNGDEIPTDNSVALIEDSNGLVVGAVLIFRDITNRRKNEKELEKHRDNLEDLVEQRTLELQSMNEQLKNEIAERNRTEEERKVLQSKLERARRMESLGVLAGGVAHDLNNLLGPLVLYPQLILEKFALDSQCEDYVNKMEISAKRAASVVQDLLTIARRERYEMTQISVNEVITSYLKSPEVELLQSDNSAISINTKFDSTIPKANGSASHLYKVFMNLVMNSFDALPAGGEISITTESKELTHLANGFDRIEAGNYIIITVSDNGPGIPEENLNRIFEPFFSNKHLGRSGSGLGLAIVYGIIKDHNGYIDVKSKLNEGTTFVLYLPAVKSKICNPKMTESIGIQGNEFVLVVDDLEEQRELAETALTCFGYNVKSVPSGEDAVEHLKSNPVDIVLLDMIMDPGMDGLDTYREIIKINPEQKAIIVSGYAESDRVQEALKLGVSRFIRKPYTIQVLCNAIRKTLANQDEDNIEQQNESVEPQIPGETNYWT